MFFALSFRKKIDFYFFIHPNTLTNWIVRPFFQVVKKFKITIEFGTLLWKWARTIQPFTIHSNIHNILQYKKKFISFFFSSVLLSFKTKITNFFHIRGNISYGSSISFFLLFLNWNITFILLERQWQQSEKFVFFIFLSSEKKFQIGTDLMMMCVWLGSA